MGSIIELNDTLQLTNEQGFPSDLLNIERHRLKAISIKDIENNLFLFKNKSDARLFHLDPVRVFLVENISGKWLFWGKVLIQSQEISKKVDNPENWKVGEWLTSGTYKIIEIYEPGYQEIFTRKESPLGKSYF